MLQTTLYFFSFLVITSLLSAQVPASKLNVDLYYQWKEATEGSSTETLTPLLVKGQLSVIKRLTLQSNGIFKYSVGDIASIAIPLNSLENWIANPAIVRLEAHRVQPAELFDEDTIMLSNNNAYAAHSGQGLLPNGFRGEGTLVGIIDDGYEWEHPDFWHPADSSTRILYLWDQLHYAPSFFESFYAYGSSWDSAAINADLITHPPKGHGAHVLGTAAGNGLAANKYLGLAPESDIIAVALSESGPFLNYFVDGLHFIFSKADELGRPCAVNSSVGTYFGSHDGKDLYSELIDAMLDEKPGRALIQAGGNAREYPMHWRGQLDHPQDTARVWLKNYTPTDKYITTLFADTADLNPLNFSFELIDFATHQVKARSSSYNVLKDLNYTGLMPATFVDTFFLNNGIPVTLQLDIAVYDGVYELWLQIRNTPDNADYWQITFSGQGLVDFWGSSVNMGNSNMVMDGNTAHYVNPDNKQTIVGFWTCSDKVITVASYQNRSALENYSGDTVSLATTGYPQWGISHFSSLGPTRDGRQKPDLTAPGGQVMSAAPVNTLNNYRNNGFPYLDRAGWHVSNRGTSMAAPMVTGAGALYFQCRPNATYQDLKLALQQSAAVDSFVLLESSQVPNIHWGSGKLNVFPLLENCLIHGCTNSNAPNYDSTAHIEDGSCIIMNTNKLNNTSPSIQCYPIPADDVIQIVLPKHFPQNSTVEITLFHISGKKVMQDYTIPTQNQLNVNTIHLPSGLYILQLQSKSKALASQKVIILH